MKNKKKEKEPVYHVNIPDVAELELLRKENKELKETKKILRSFIKYLLSIGEKSGD